MKDYFFTSESVTEGHPDKLCDTISDAILDACLEQDKNAKVAAETFASKNKITVAGEISTSAVIDIEKIVRSTVQEIGYDDEETGMDYRTCEVKVNVTKQSPDIALGVDSGGAGDQGIMFGYACDETPELMPFPIYYAHLLAKRLTDVRKQTILDYLKPDGKTQVTVQYENGIPKRIDTILISNQHKNGISLEKMKQDLITEVIMPVIDKKYLEENTKIYVNPTGRFVIGGPLGDVGLTGRKIIVDTYGGYSRHGGGAFSGKDPSKVDRSAAYMLRHVAKSVVASGLAKKCEIELSYAIGMDKPLSIAIDTFGTNTISEQEILQRIQQNFDFRPNAMISYLNLKMPVYSKTTNYGHFGKPELPWERIKRI